MTRGSHESGVFPGEEISLLKSAGSLPPQMADFVRSSLGISRPKSHGSKPLTRSSRESSRPCTVAVLEDKPLHGSKTLTRSSRESSCWSALAVPEDKPLHGEQVPDSQQPRVELLVCVGST